MAATRLRWLKPRSMLRQAAPVSKQHPIALVAKVGTVGNTGLCFVPLPFHHFVISSAPHHSICFTKTPSCISASDIAPTRNPVSTSKALYNPCTATFTASRFMLIIWLLTPILHTGAAHPGSTSPPYPYDEAIDNGTFGYYPTSTFATENDISAPKVNWLQWDERCNDGTYYFLTPKGWGLPRPGPMILDWRGDLVWSQHFANEWGGQAYDFMVQHYQGRDRLTFWTGDDTVRGHGSGKYMIVSAVLSDRCDRDASTSEQDRILTFRQVELKLRTSTQCRCRKQLGRGSARVPVDP